MILINGLSMLILDGSVTPIGDVSRRGFDYTTFPSSRLSSELLI